MWNCKGTGWHSHRDVNAVHLCAYGEHILCNSGYNGADKGAEGFSWDYIHNIAESSNTVLINGVNHRSRAGGGITEGFTAPLFAYAKGYSGFALSDGDHWRSFVFVYPQDGRNGYWILFDEVHDASSSNKVNVVLHPFSNNCSTVSDKREYRWKMGPVSYSGHEVFLTIFLGTAPITAELKDGVLGGWSDSFVGKYLYSTYDTDDEGKRNIVTVLFPHDADHAKASMGRILGEGFTGGSVDLGDSIVDVALESSGADVLEYNDVSFRGLATLYRLNAGSNVFYFVRKGNSFDNGVTLRRGFESDAEVSVYVKDRAGKIIAPGAEVTFYFPGIHGVLVDGAHVPVLDSGDGWVRIAVAEGTHDLEFSTVGGDTDVEEGAAPSSVPGFYALYPNRPNPFNPDTEIRYALPTSGRVRLAVVDLLGREVVTLVDGRADGGVHRVRWDGRDGLGVEVGSGVYFYRMQVDGSVRARKMVRVK